MKYFVKEQLEKIESKKISQERADEKLGNLQTVFLIEKCLKLIKNAKKVM